MPKNELKLNIRKIPEAPDFFEFTIATPMLRSQFRLPRSKVNDLRVLLEQALVEK